VKPYACVRRYWAEHFPAWPVVTADSETKIFSLSQARNNAARQADTDILVFCDADTCPPTESVRIAVADPVGVCWPHEFWRLIPAEYAELPFKEFPSAPILREHPDGLGGCMVATAEEYWALGGQPEEFEGWGHEDRCFHMVVQTLSTVRRIGGIAYSIEHNEQLRIADSPGWNRNRTKNQTKARPYEAATNKPWLMRELLRIRYETPPGPGEPDPVKRELFGIQQDWHTRWVTP
jgi:hypothetical protein